MLLIIRVVRRTFALATPFSGISDLSAENLPRPHKKEISPTASFGRIYKDRGKTGEQRVGAKPGFPFHLLRN